MIYAVRKRNGSHSLVELKSHKELCELNENRTDETLCYSHVSRSYAHQWVRNGREHETGLYIDGNRVRYAKAGV